MTIHDPVLPALKSAEVARPEWLEILRALLRSKTFLVGLSIVLFWTLCALFWPLIVPYDPQALNAANTFQPPSAEHWFGTDDFGRDVFSRVLAGAAPVFATAPAATALGILGGLLLGMTAALCGGWVDAAIMRFVDALLAFPLLIFAIAVLAVVGGSALNVILVIGLAFAPNIARTIRSAVLEEQEKEYVAAAHLLGNSLAAIAVREILPNIWPVVTVEATVRLGYAIFASATLSFLALGLQQPSPDWGLTIALGRGYVQYAAWMVLFPAAALATLVVGVNLLADGLRDVLEE
ncbi:MAG TPA: ABC transporter permease [Kiloniellales bacterium]|nr:ABC transporter permease [Kiloniellales bacterium]